MSMTASRPACRVIGSDAERRDIPLKGIVVRRPNTTVISRSNTNSGTQLRSDVGTPPDVVAHHALPGSIRQGVLDTLLLCGALRSLLWSTLSNSGHYRSSGIYPGLVLWNRIVTTTKNKKRRSTRNQQPARPQASTSGQAGSSRTTTLSKDPRLKPGERRDSSSSPREAGPADPASEGSGVGPTGRVNLLKSSPLTSLEPSIVLNQVPRIQVRQASQSDHASQRSDNGNRRASRSLDPRRITVEEVDDEEDVRASRASPVAGLAPRRDDTSVLPSSSPLPPSNTSSMWPEERDERRKMKQRRSRADSIESAQHHRSCSKLKYKWLAGGEKAAASTADRDAPLKVNMFNASRKSMLISILDRGRYVLLRGSDEQRQGPTVQWASEADEY
ncbi:hypothetical protein FB45DRAFT_1138754 [Roridomyces roridus]|uniref:Uncharacterized protein n=1 Tax=Roridomyces roridus TaxID=1738132 RepID=A0AAD7C1V1_9AGAR|nr:hypothetical protein FB45DRAFT_1138754 [Roridomyces roridus]